MILFCGDKKLDTSPEFGWILPQNFADKLELTLYEKGRFRLGKTIILYTLNRTYTVRMTIIAFLKIDGGGFAFLGVFLKDC